MTPNTNGTDTPPPLRLSMTLPGSASLGAYQAGAVSALAVAVNALRDGGRRVHLDAVGGASAGSIVAMIFSHCLMTGRDAPEMLRSAWVDEVDVDVLKATGSGSPLSFDDLRTKLDDFLSDTQEHPFDVHPRLDESVEIQVGLTSLLGFTQSAESGGHSVSSLTYADWSSHVLHPHGDHREVLEPQGGSASSLLDAVLASAAHPIAFEPQRLDRTGDDLDGRGHENLPDDRRLWYTDGGLVESQPIGRIIQAARRSAGHADGVRLHLVVDPRSSGPSGNEEWSDPESVKGWMDGLRRAVSVVPTQALHDDLRTTATINDQLDTLDETMAWLTDHVDLGGHGDELRDRIAGLARISGKERVDVEMISPLLEASGEADDGVNDLLAGDFAGAFGGFLSQRVRRSDYVLGWRTARRWIENGGLERHDVDDDAIGAVLSAIDGREHDRWHDAILDGDDDGVDQLDRTGRWRLALLAARFARVAIGQAMPLPPNPIARRGHR